MENLKIIPDIRENLEEGLWISIVPRILYLSFSIGKASLEVLVDDRTSMANFSADYCGYCCVEAQVKILDNKFSPPCFDTLRWLPWDKIWNAERDASMAVEFQVLMENE